MNRFREHLREKFSYLAADADAQLEHLDALGVPGIIDELALEFDDLAKMAKTKLEEGELSQFQFSQIVAVSGELENMSGPQNADLWTEHALRNSKQWHQVRKMAQDYLNHASE